MPNLWSLLYTNYYRWRLRFFLYPPLNMLTAVGRFSLRLLWTLRHCTPYQLETRSVFTITNIHITYEPILWGGSDSGDASIRGNGLGYGDGFSKNALAGSGHNEISRIMYTTLHSIFTITSNKFKLQHHPIIWSSMHEFNTSNYELHWHSIAKPKPYTN